MRLDALARFAEREQERSDAVQQIARRRSRSVRRGVDRRRRPGDHVTWNSARARSVASGSSPVEIGATSREKLYLHGGATIPDQRDAVGGGLVSFVKARLGIDEDAEEAKTSRGARLD